MKKHSPNILALCLALTCITPPTHASSLTTFKKVAVSILAITNLANTQTGSTIDFAGDVGTHTSLQLNSHGYPVMAYHDEDNHALKLAVCSDPTCSADATITTVDDNGFVGWDNSLQLDDDDYPVISYYDLGNQALKIARCDDTTCRTHTTLTIVDESGTVGSYTSLQLDSEGYPVISYYDADNTALKLAVCGDPYCSGNNTLTFVDTEGLVGEYTSLQLDSDDNPVISYYDETHTSLKLARCSDPFCMFNTTITTVDDDGFVGWDTSLQLNADDNPVISYFDWGKGHLNIAICHTPTCSDNTTHIATIDPDGEVGSYTALQLDSGDSPVVAYYDERNGDLKLALCATPICSGNTTMTTLDGEGDVGEYASLQIDASRHAVISYYDRTAHDLRLATYLLYSTLASTSIDATIYKIGNEFPVNTYTYDDQWSSSVSSLPSGGFVVTWVNEWQDGSQYGVYGQIFADNGSKVGEEFQVNTYTDNTQQSSSVSSLPSGGFVVTWVSNGQDGWGIYGQIFADDGSKIGHEFQIKTYTDDDQGHLSVSSLLRGGFVVTWESNGQDGVYGQIFADDGSKVGEEFQINTYTSGYQARPSVSSLLSGGFVVTWDSNRQDGYLWGIYGKIFTFDDHYNRAPIVIQAIPAQTIRTGEEFIFTINGNDYFQDPEGQTLLFSAKEAGETTLPKWLVFNANTQGLQGTPLYYDQGSYTIYITAQDPIGASINQSFTIKVIMNQDDASWLFSNVYKINEEFPVNTYTDDDQGRPSVSSLLSGGFVVTWVSDGQDGDGYGVYGQIFTDNGTQVGEEFPVNNYTYDDQSSPSVSSLPSGGFVVTWMSYGQDDFWWIMYGWDIYGQIFTDDGTKVGEQFQINTYTNGSQSLPSVSSLQSGGFVVTWQRGDFRSGWWWTGQDLADSGVYGQIFYLSHNTIPVVIRQIPSQHAIVGERFTYTLNITHYFQDPNGDELTLNVAEQGSDNLPQWLSFDETSYEFVGSPLAEDIGNHTINVKATDVTGASVSQNFIIIVDLPPTPSPSYAPTAEPTQPTNSPTVSPSVSSSMSLLETLENLSTETITIIATTTLASLLILCCACSFCIKKYRDKKKAAVNDFPFMLQQEGGVPMMTQELEMTVLIDPAQRQTYLNLLHHFLTHPTRILWQGWHDVQEGGNPEASLYCILTNDDTLFLLDEAPHVEHLPHADDLPLKHTIDLSQYTFVGPRQDNSSITTFTLAKVNLRIEKQLPDNAFTFHRPHNTRRFSDPILKPYLHKLAEEEKLRDTLMDSLASQGVKQSSIDDLEQWLNDNNFDDEALLDDLNNESEESNMKRHFERLYGMIEPWIHFDTLHAIRCATYHYYYLDEITQTVQPFQVDLSLGEDQYTLVQFTFQTAQDKNRAQAHLYLLIPRRYRSTYQDLALLFEHFFNTDVYRLTQYNELTSLEKNQSPIYGEDLAASYHLVLAPSMRYDHLMPPQSTKKKQDDAEEEEEIDEAPLLLQDNCPHLPTQKNNDITSTIALQCPIYFAVKEKGQYTQHHLDHLRAYQHGVKPSCPHNDQCQSLEQILKNEIETPSQYLTHVCHMHLFQHPVRRRNIVKSDESTTKLKLSYKRSAHPMHNELTTPLLLQDDEKDDRKEEEKTEEGAIMTTQQATSPASRLPKKDFLNRVKLQSTSSKRTVSEPNLATLDDKCDPFTYQKDFAQMHPIDLRNQNPLECLQDPRAFLKELLLEIIQQGLMGKIVDTSNSQAIEQIQNVTYPTSSELSWLASNVERKLSSEANRNLTLPLHIAEMAAIALYTSTKCYIELGTAQRSGDFDTFVVWDRYLMQAILKLHIDELKKKLKTKRYLYSGIGGIQLKQKTQIGFFKTYTSTSLEVSVAMGFKDSGPGMMMYLTPKMQKRFICCDVSWISCFSHEAEILFARSADIGIFPAPKWKAIIIEKQDDPNTQRVLFRPAAMPLIVGKNQTKELAPLKRNPSIPLATSNWKRTLPLPWLLTILQPSKEVH